MDRMNGNDHDLESLAERLRAQAPLPAVSEELFRRLERRATWQTAPKPGWWLGLALGAVLLGVAIWWGGRPDNGFAPEAIPVVGTASGSVVPERVEPTPAIPQPVPVAWAPALEEDITGVLAPISRQHLRSEPAFHFDLDSVATRGERRQDIL